MPIINPDTSGAKDYSLTEPGTYPATIISVDFRPSKKGNPMIVPTFRIKVGSSPIPKDREAFLVISGEGAYGFDQLLRAAGFVELANQYADPSSPNPDFNTDQLVGQEVLVVLTHRKMDDGSFRDSIDSYLPK